MLSLPKTVHSCDGKFLELSEMEPDPTSSPPPPPNVPNTILLGLVSPISLSETLKFLNQTKKIETVGSVLLLNGFIFGGSLLVRDYLMFPILFDYLAVFSREDVSEATAKQVFNVLLLGPMFVLSNILNIVWYSEIVDSFWRSMHSTKSPKPRSAQETLRDELYRVALFCVLILQSYFCLTLLPSYVGIPLDFLQQCFTIAFYCYDYGWTLQGLGLQARLHMFQTHWAFMLGFGAPLSLINSVLPMFWGYTLYSLLFPVCAILAMQKKPIKHSGGWDEVRVFLVAQFVTFYLLKAITACACPPKRQRKQE